MMPVIEMKNIFFTYGTHVVLEDVSLTVHEGDFLALIGPNGSGKTTLIKLILGLLKPVKGSIILFGTELSKFRQWYRIGYVPQRPGFDNNFPATVEEVVASGRFGRVGLLRRLKERDRRVIDQVLDVVGLSELRKRPITDLSGGQQQRAFIARALVEEPDILILDEPQTGLDEGALNSFYQLLKYLNREKGIALLMVSHDVGVVGRWVSRVACLNKKLICHGAPREILTPHNLFRLYGTDVRAVVHGH